MAYLAASATSLLEQLDATGVRSDEHRGPVLPDGLTTREQAISTVPALHIVATLIGSLQTLRTLSSAVRNIALDVRQMLVR
jgi:hypothetical protein